MTLRIAVVAAVLALAGSYLIANGRSEAHQPFDRACGIQDQQFLRDYRLSLGSTLSDADSMHDAAAQMEKEATNDPTLKMVQLLAGQMFTDYAMAARQEDHGRDGSQLVLAAQGIHDRIAAILEKATQRLVGEGCPLG